MTRCRAWISRGSANIYYSRVKRTLSAKEGASSSRAPKETSGPKQCLASSAFRNSALISSVLATSTGFWPELMEAFSPTTNDQR